MEFRLKNRLDEIQSLAEAIELWGEENGIPAKTLFQVNLALDELLTNTISYGYPEGGEHEIVVQLAREREGELLIGVHDDGLAFNPLEAKEPDINQDIEERPIGGLGIYLVRQMIDEIDYSWKDQRNILVMKKRY